MPQVNWFGVMLLGAFKLKDSEMQVAGQKAFLRGIAIGEILHSVVVGSPLALASFRHNELLDYRFQESEAEMDGIRQKTNLDQRTVMASFDLSLIDLLK
jgi:hypothetical protein